MKTSPETAALNDLLNTLNNPDIAGVTPLDQRTATPERRDTALDELNKQAMLKSKAALIAASVPSSRKLFFTGRLSAGKDFVAAAVGAKTFSFAEPLYAIASHCFGVEVTATKGKDLPGVRAFLQIIGQWGRGTINEQYPLTISRALFVERTRENGLKGVFGSWGVEWSNYGREDSIWLAACILNANSFLEANPSARVAITNARFANEFKHLQAGGWTHYHCLCSPQTWAQRLLKIKLTPESPVVKDLSEALAAGLDNDVIKQLSAHKDGPTLRAIWSDEVVSKPSGRLHSVESFLKSLH